MAQEPGNSAPTIYCTQCGGAMRIAPENIRVKVACPHCHSIVEPWRVLDQQPGQQAHAQQDQAPQEHADAQGAYASPQQSPSPYGHPPGEQQPVPPPPPPHGGAPNTMVPPPYHGSVSSKNKVVAGLLGLFLGSLGIHRFYLGHTTVGVIQLLLTICSCGALIYVTTIWGVVEGILCFTGHLRDANDLPLRD
ncbi:MAG: TM2 domain-containing protein [Phycisphaerae bacterium]